MADRQPLAQKNGLRITVLLILIVLLLIGILIPVKFLPGALSSLGNTLSAIFVSQEKVNLSVDKSTINSGDKIIISWTGKHRADGTYEFSYSCSAGVHIETSINHPYETAACDSPFYFSPKDNTIGLNAFSEVKRYADTKITLGFLKKGSSVVDTLASLNIMITNTKAPDGLTASSTGTKATTTPKTKPVIAPKPVYPTYNPNGLADLKVTSLGVGPLSVHFDITNVGDKNTGPWFFKANLPSQTNPLYTSTVQPNLYPGDHIEYTLSFKNLNNSSVNLATIIADPSNLIPEYSEANNTLAVRLNSGTGTTVGLPDLTIRITATGTVNRSNGELTQIGSVSSSDRAGIKFEVQNIRDTATGNWRFRADLPSSNSNSKTYISEVQPALKPGEKAIYTIGFDNIQNQGANPATITVDSSNEVRESNETNNIATVSIVRN